MSSDMHRRRSTGNYGGIKMADISNVKGNGNSNNLSDLNDDEINIELKSDEIVEVPELGEVTIDVKALQHFVQKLDSDDEVTDFSSGMFSKFDISNGYGHMKIKEEHMKYTSFLTRFGHFQFCYGFYGGKNFPCYFG